MRKRMVSILCVLTLCLTLLPVTALAVGEKEQYRNHPLFVDLDLDDKTDSDDENFVVMQTGAVILGPTDGTLEKSFDDGSEYVLQNPSQAARTITEGTPVAFVDEQNEKAYFFLPTQVSPAADAITFSCDPASTALEDLFHTFSLSYKHKELFLPHIKCEWDEGKFECDIIGESDLTFSLTPDDIDVDWTVEYDLKNVVMESNRGFDAQVSAGAVPLGDMETALQIDFALSAADAIYVSFDLTDEKAVIQADGPLSRELSFADGKQDPTLQVNKIISEGDFEVALTICLSGNLFHIMEFGCNMSEQISVAAKLTGNEGRNEAGQPWHICKHLSCLDGTVERNSKSVAYIHTAQKEHDQEQTVSSGSTPFYYSFTFDEFGWDDACPHLLYPVEVTVLDADEKPVEGADVRYSPEENYTPGTIDYCTAVTDDKGLATLYLPEGKEHTITASIQRPAGAPGNDDATVQSAVDCTVSSGSLPARAEIRMPSSEDLCLVTFDENAKGETVENMPGAIFLKEEGGTLPNEVPRREGYQFAGWATTSNGEGTYLPGDSISGNEDSVCLYATWIYQPRDEFRIITYGPNGDDVILADNPQIYKKDSNFTLRNPVREGYFFTGWTCGEVQVAEPLMEVVVSWNGQSDSADDYINRTYVANWESMKYNVVWRNWDGSYLNVTRNVYDILPDYSGPTPTRAPDDQKYYVFAGWKPEMQVVTEDAEYTAVYNEYERLKFLASPQDVTLKAGETAVFRAETAGGEGNVAYQWYQIPSGAGADDGQPISGETTDTLTLTADDSMNGNRYYCVATDEVGQQIVSDEASLVIPAPQQGGGSSSNYSTTVESASNGAMSVSPQNASKGTTVTITVTPNDGYALDTLTVTDASGNKLALTDQGKGQYTFIMPASAVTVSATFKAESSTLPFTDVKGGDWFYDAVQYVYDNGMMNGMGNDQFAPNTTLSRGMIAQVLYNLEQNPAADGSAFTDVTAGAWYTDAVTWAAKNGIVAGYGDGTFGPENSITREQLAAIFYRYAQYKGYDVSVGEDTNILSYTDAFEISEYAVPAFQWACGSGIIHGVTESTLVPQGNATRAQVATMLMHFCENIAK